MRRVVTTALGAMLTASFVVLACGDGYEEGENANPAPAQGTLDGDCYPNSTCNEGLACAVVSGQAKCRPPGSGTPVDAAVDGGGPTDAEVPVERDANTPDAEVSDAPLSPDPCVVKVSNFPCVSQALPIACFGSLQQCSGNGCDPDEIAWRCSSPKQCLEGKSCCLKAAGFNVPADSSCDEASVVIGSPNNSTKCNDSCDNNEVPLCSTDADCKPGRHCRQRKLSSDSTLNGFVVGFCVPQ